MSLSIKAQIEEKLNGGMYEDILSLIRQYESRHPMDMDILSYYVSYFMQMGDLEKALYYAKSGVRRYPTNGDMYYNLAFVYEIMEDWLEAFKNYVKAQHIYDYCGDEKKDSLEFDAKFSYIWNRYDNEVKEIHDEDRLMEISDRIERHMDLLDSCFGLLDAMYRNKDIQAIGKYLWLNDDERRYIALYRAMPSRHLAENQWNMMQQKAELLRANRDNTYVVEGEAKEYLLPVAVENRNTVHIFTQEGKEYPVIQREYRHFNYYRVKSGTQVCSSDITYYGEPVPLGHDPKRKKLVLNIFVDGLSQMVLNGDDFEKIMPNTYAFFKKGVICTEAHSAAEWTYPSIANYVSGLDTLHHMMFHNELVGYLPKDVPTLAEYFKRMGYYTAKLDGDWRSTATYGHTRGYDRCVYQNGALGFKSEMVMGDVLTQLEGFQDTDQFVWMCTHDLHDVADGYDFPVGVQGELELSSCTIEEVGETSVKQAASEKKKCAYVKLVHHIDVLLQTLYSYIETHYEEDEILVGLFADHGQGYLVSEDAPSFMSKGRTNVAFMFRGGISPQITDELISSSDYISIMCKLAGIEMDAVETQSHLPVCFGGAEERKYVLSESLHPKDPYYATYYARDYTVYFQNNAPVGEDGRFVLKDYTLCIEDKEGNAVEDQALYDTYLALVLEHIAPLLIYDE